MIDTIREFIDTIREFLNTELALWLFSSLPGGSTIRGLIQNIYNIFNRRFKHHSDILRQLSLDEEPQKILGKFSAWIFSEGSAREDKKKNNLLLIICAAAMVISILGTIMFLKGGYSASFAGIAASQGIQFSSKVDVSEFAWNSFYFSLVAVFVLSIVYTVLHMLSFKKWINPISFIARMFWLTFPFVYGFMLLGVEPFLGAMLGLAITIVIVSSKEKIKRHKMHFAGLDQTVIKINNHFKKIKKYEIFDKDVIDRDIETFEKGTVLLTIYMILMFALSFSIIVCQLVYNDFASFFSNKFWNFSFGTYSFTILEIILQQFILAFFVSLVIVRIKLVISRKKPAMKMFITRINFINDSFSDFFSYVVFGSIFMVIFSIYCTTAIAATIASIILTQLYCIIEFMVKRKKEFEEMEVRIQGYEDRLALKKEKEETEEKKRIKEQEDKEAKQAALRAEQEAKEAEQQRVKAEQEAERAKRIAEEEADAIAKKEAAEAEKAREAAAKAANDAKLLADQEAKKAKQAEKERLEAEKEAKEAEIAFQNALIEIINAMRESDEEFRISRID